MATSSGLFLATIYNQSQLAERKHVARCWSINTAAMAVPLSAHPSPLVITTKLAAAISSVGLFGQGVLPAQYCPCGCICLRWRRMYYAVTDTEVCANFSSLETMRLN